MIPRCSFGVALLILFLATPLRAQSLTATDSQNDNWTLSPTSARLIPDATRYPRLVLDLAALAAAPMQFTIDTDATEIRLRRSSRRAEIPIASSPLTLTLVADAAAPAIYVDSKPFTEAAEDWTRIIQRSSSVDTLTLEFRSATRAIVYWKPDPLIKVTAPPAASPSSPSSSSNSTAALSAAQQLALRLNKSVVTLRITNVKSDFPILSHALVLSAQGRLLTSADHLAQAESFTVLIDDKPINAIPLAVDPALDLAILQLDPSSYLWQAHIQPLQWTDAMPARRETLYNLVFMPDRTLIAAEADFNQLVDFASLPEDIRNTWPLSTLSRWITLSDPVSPASSFLPLVNSSGQALGLCLWSCPVTIASSSTRDRLTSRPDSAPSISLSNRRRQPGFVLSYPSIQDFITKPLPFTPMPFDQLRKTLAATPSPSVAIDALADPAQPAGVDELRRTTLTLEKAMVCRSCQGTGKQTTRVIDHYETRGALRVPIFIDREDPCPQCDGAGYNNAIVLMRVLARVASLLAALPPEAPVTTTPPSTPIARPDPNDQHAALDNLNETLTHIASLNAPSLAQLLNAVAARSLDDHSLTPGQPFASMGYVVSQSLPDDYMPLTMVAIVDPATQTPTRFVLLRAPRLAPDRVRGTVLVTGIVTSFLTIPDYPPVPLLDDALVITTPDLTPPKEEPRPSSTTTTTPPRNPFTGPRSDRPSPDSRDSRDTPRRRD